jgi:hypothetical protein
MLPNKPAARLSAPGKQTRQSDRCHPASRRGIQRGLGRRHSLVTSANWNWYEVCAVTPNLLEQQRTSELPQPVDKAPRDNSRNSVTPAALSMPIVLQFRLTRRR